MGLNENHCCYFLKFGTEPRPPFQDNAVTTSGPMGFLLNFHVGIVQEFCRGWQNFKALVEMYHGYVQFCHIGRILKVLGYVNNVQIDLHPRACWQ